MSKDDEILKVDGESTPPPPAAGKHRGEKLKKALLAIGEAPVINDAPAGKRQGASTLAQRMAARNQRLQEEASRNAQRPEVKGVWYLRCPCSKGAPGIFFTRKPDLSRDKITSNDIWYASYRNPDDPWPKGRDPICQVCLDQSGQAKSLRIRPRFLEKMPASEVEELMAEEVAGE